jgi:hypothetical protein
MYRKEIVLAFDKTQSLLRDTVTTDTMSQGGVDVFLVSNSAGSHAATRGINGEIPGRQLNLQQNAVTLIPWYDRVVVNDFNMFTAQGDLRLPMQRDVMATINRKIDEDIVNALTSGTINTGTAAPATVNLFLRAKTILQNGLVPDDGNIFLVCTPAFLNLLQQAPEFSSSLYVAGRSPFADGTPAWGDNKMVYKWNGVTIISNPTLPGAGTTAAKCYMYHKNAIGHAVNTGTMDMSMGFNEEHQYTWANCKVFMGSTLLQNSGVVTINSDDSSLSS